MACLTSTRILGLGLIHDVISESAKSIPSYMDSTLLENQNKRIFRIIQEYIVVYGDRYKREPALANFRRKSERF